MATNRRISVLILVFFMLVFHVVFQRKDFNEDERFMPVEDEEDGDQTDLVLDANNTAPDVNKILLVNSSLSVI